MRTIQVYEPALCCNTGVCGADVDQALVTFTADLEHLKGRGADIARHNLANDPSSFAANDTVRAYLQVAGSEGLPLTLVGGVTVMAGSYPTRAQLLAYAQLADVVAVPPGITRIELTETSRGADSPTGCC
jgi:hypothetical protein